ncbi:MAG: TrkH family potassium uptake protein [Acetobacterium sp.]
MNRKMVSYVLGRILVITGLLMLPALVVSLIYQEGWQGLWPFLLSIIITSTIGLLISLKKPTRSDFFAREGLVAVALSWLAMSFFGSLPFIFSGAIPNPIDAFFETASGFSTTGASILTNVEMLSHSLLWWRSFTHLIGGMGVLVLALAVMPKIESGGVFIMRAEVPGPTFGKVRTKLRSSAQILYLIYLSMTVVLVLLLTLGGMPLFDSFIHAFGTAGTGGFSDKAASVSYYNSAYIDYVLSISMILFGVNFNLYYALFFMHTKNIFKNEELRWYLGFIAGAFTLICINVSPLYSSVSLLFRDVFFTVSTIITTTGYATANFDTWPVFSHVILLLLMFVGGMAGSTAGGIKVSRIAIYIKTTINEIRINVSPNRRLPILFEDKPIGTVLSHQTSVYLITYTFIFVIFLFIISLSAPNFVTAFSAVAATFNNIGPGLDMVGPMGNYSGFNNLTKLTLSLAMIMGRLEIFPILVLFSPRTWRRG